ncbi:PulJ/GspJ family protein [Catenovulum adriaticum]|uniref:Type II secretion system GspH family protein n=1 Tax=Catenovulum adriaticum TaxID=2984846 RepID=A0ABY7AN47_9ALTE|nr:type II secretion system protein [Catenovulum sp. TS8]WAJ70066.1 type II secretion system GspH family protein [Catenovulum sp. TS8]
MYLPTRPKSSGFTLIELILVIVILAIVGTFSARFLGWGAQYYVDVTERQRVLDDSRFIVERLTRELRNALPYSLRVKTDASANYACLEYVPIITSGHYLTIPVNSSDNKLSLISPSTGNTLASGQNISIYPTNPDKVYNVLNQQTYRINSVEAVETDDDSQQINFANNINFASGSPAKRYYIWQTPVSYCLENNKIYRYQGYSAGVNQYNPTQLKALSGVSYHLMAQDVSNQLTTEPPFRLDSSGLIRHAQVALYLKFSRFTDNTEDMFFYHLVQVPNAP